MSATPITFAGVTLTETTAKAEVTAVPADIAAMFAGVVTHLSDQPNTKNMSFELPESAPMSPESFRAMVQTYAKDHNLAYGLPKHVPAHRTADKVDKATGKVTAGKDVADNGKPAHWNVGRNITFRFSAHADKSTVDTKTVTVTPAADLKTPKSGK